MMAARRPSSLLGFITVDPQAVILTAFLVPLTIFAHEIGHYLIGIAVDVPNPEIGLSGFKHAPAPWLSIRKAAAIGIAGPAITLILAVAGLTTKQGGTRLGRAISLAACMRLCEILPFAVLALARWTISKPAQRTTFDEARVFELVGWNGNLGLVVMSTALSFIAVSVLRKQTAQMSRSLLLGGILGWTTWRVLFEAGVIS